MVSTSIYLSICVALASAAYGSETSTSLAFRYLFTFGNSYSQTGFNISLEKPSASNPIGNPPFPGYTTSGGNNWLTFVSKTPSPSLLAYNFAYGGATTSAELIAPFEPTVLSLIDQVSLFTSNLAPPPTYASWTSADSLFGIWIGVNDVGNGWHRDNWTTLVETIISTYVSQVSTLYSSGARNFVFLTVPPIELTPLIRTDSADNQKAVAEAVVQYNTLLTAAVNTFAGDKTDVKMWVVDTAPAFNAAVADPGAYGAPNATCWDEDGVSCLWFNDYHPGQAIQKMVGEAVVLEVGI
ncbi:unnamed protein product [Diplocarpon coronariae]|uniref:Carbohydrate esterase family 16 protein n=1 Tax=Diplocarpon coronariae TaxID=2795749 RepID=A0A218ZDK2_9HELO|nr:carbohydrate esterase family 16 protein [Marssonina coronariae]